MSLKLRRTIGFYSLLLLGITLNSFQVYKYMTNQLGDFKMEVVVLIVGVAFNFAPNYLLRLFEKLVVKNNKNEN